MRQPCQPGKFATLPISPEIGSTGPVQLMPMPTGVTPVSRMQSFRQHDLVYVGDAERARDNRDRWLQLGAEILESLGLAVEIVVANDPFFGRVGRILAESQRSETLKFEIVTPIHSAEHQTAIASANCHLDHFGAPFGIVTAEGEVAHSC